VARRKVNKNLTLEEILEKERVILTALVIVSEDNLFPQASTDAFVYAFPDSYAPCQYDVMAFVDDNFMLAS
jgi:hypothetical protein